MENNSDWLYTLKGCFFMKTLCIWSFPKLLWPSYRFIRPQVAQLFLLCILGFWPWPYIKMIFPLMLFSFLPIRMLLIPKFIERKYLQVLDGVHPWQEVAPKRGRNIEVRNCTKSSINNTNAEGSLNGHKMLHQLLVFSPLNTCIKHALLICADNINGHVNTYIEKVSVNVTPPRTHEKLA